ncbi:GSCOCG00009753001-RA-CDS [Cotesia congregata]|nr:GSCOCG00009753001-RA-CDS [Cotesia congregata]
MPGIRKQLNSFIITMDFKSLVFFLIFAFMVTQIECGVDYHVELSLRYNSTHNNWMVYDIIPQLDNGAEISCWESNGELVLENNSPSDGLSKKESFKKVDLTPPEKLHSMEGLWYKFGLCIPEINQLSYRSKYLEEAIRLFQKYNVEDILRQSNITPGKNYTYREISDVVSKGIDGKKPIVKCLLDKNNHLLLDRITIFFDKSLNLINPMRRHYRGKCPSYLPIVYQNSTSDPNFYGNLKFYDDPLNKYPTLREDDNGYYYLTQQVNPAECYPPLALETCHDPKYSWVIDSFIFAFKSNINFTCELGGIDPCDHEGQFNFTSLSSIRYEIFGKWGIGKIPQNFSEEEVLCRSWRQQDVCTLYLKGIDSELKVYKKSIELFDKYNMDKILRRSNILPGKNYTYQELSDAGSKGINGKPLIFSCRPSLTNEPAKQILFGIGFFMDKNFKPTDPTDLEILSEGYSICRRDGQIFYQGFKDYVEELRQYKSMIGEI